MRQSTPVIYGNEKTFRIGGGKVLRQSNGDRLTVVAAGATVHEALKASDQLQRDDIPVRVIEPTASSRSTPPHCARLPMPPAPS